MPLPSETAAGVRTSDGALRPRDRESGDGQDHADHERDDAEDPQNVNGEDEPEDEQDDAEDDHRFLLFFEDVVDMDLGAARHGRLSAPRMCR